MKKSFDCAVIGAGAIGCSVAYRLSQHGLSVLVADKNEPGREATWAAAGMLAPHSEIAQNVPEALSRLFVTSFNLYPDFIAEIESVSGLKVGYLTSGSLLAAGDYLEAKVLTGLYEKLLARNVRVEELDHQQLRTAEPALAETVESAIFIPDEHAVNNRELLAALVKAAENSGVTFLCNTPVTGLETSGDSITAVKTAKGKIPAGTVINCAGSWAGKIAPELLALPLRPIRGQMMQLHVEPQNLHHLLHTSTVYFVPWPDGRTLLGATMENVGFDKSTTAGGMQHLLADGITLIPSLKDVKVTDFWAGLRPDTPDNLPLLGKTQYANYFVAAGHFRNGILLTPVTAQLISELVLSGKTSISLAPFNPTRFTD